MRVSSAAAVAAFTSALAFLGACNQTPIITPVRSLDRPSDASITCTIYAPRQATDANGKSHEIGFYQPLPLSACSPTLTPPTNTNPENPNQTFSPELRILIANSARGEVAGVDVPNEILMDFDLQNPGYNFLQVGRLPVGIRSSDDGCVSVTANADSCDLTLLDNTVIYNMSFVEQRPMNCSGIGVPATGAVTCGQIPSSEMTVGRGYAANVAREVQLWAGDHQLNSRPTAIELTQLVDPNPAATGQCMNTTYHAWVALPGCQAVVETTFSLGTTDTVLKGQITHALHVGPDGPTVVDPATLTCPNECAGASNPTLGAPDGGVGIPGDVMPATDSAPVTIAYDAEPDTQRIAIGDYYNERVSFFSLDPVTGAPASPRSVVLEHGALGVSRVRISPRTPSGKFVYAVARDGSVRVVDLDLENECETNPDPSLPQFQAMPIEDPAPGARTLGCIPLGQPNTPRRAANALGPGIYLPSGAFARDVAFVHLDNPLPPSSGVPLSAQPALLVGDFVWVFGSDGQANVVNLYDACPQPNDPIEEGSTYTPACSLTNALTSRESDYQTNIGNPYPITLERLAHRIRNGARRFLQPTDVQDINGTPRVQDPTVPLTVTINGSPGVDTNGFRLPTLESVTRNPELSLGGPPQFPGVTTYLQFNDPLQAKNETWTLDWEGVLPGTQRLFGRMCGVGDSNCPRNAFVDSGAELCAHDVRDGDKLDLLGCQRDSDCLYSQRCLRVSSPTSTLITGLCLPNNTKDNGSIEDQYRARCATLLGAERRYRISNPRQSVQIGSDVTNAMDLSEVYEPEYAPQTISCKTVTGPEALSECTQITVPSPSVNVSRLPLSTQCMPDWDGALRCLRPCNPDNAKQDAPGDPSSACGTGYVCAASSFSTAQTPDYRCMRAPLDLGLFADCLGYPQRYQIRAGDAFTVYGGSTGYLFEENPDPTTGVCAPVPAIDERTRIRNSRISLDAPNCPLRPGQPGVDALTWQGSAAPNACNLDSPDNDLLLHYENPVLAMALRLPNNPGGQVPSDATRIQFGVVGGTYGLSTLLSVNNSQPAQSVVSSTVAPDHQSVFVVDEGKGSAVTALRGQLLRLVTFDQFVDPNFPIR